MPHLCDTIPSFHVRSAVHALSQALCGHRLWSGVVLSGGQGLAPCPAGLGLLQLLPTLIGTPPLLRRPGVEAQAQQS